MNKGLIPTISVVIILAICVSLIVLGLHPDGKEFSDSFSSAEEYLKALPAYKEHPLTQLRVWWVKNYFLLKLTFTVSVLVLVSYGIWYWRIYRAIKNA